MTYVLQQPLRWLVPLVVRRHAHCADAARPPGTLQRAAAEQRCRCRGSSPSWGSRRRGGTHSSRCRERSWSAHAAGCFLADALAAAVLPLLLMVSSQCSKSISVATPQKRACSCPSAHGSVAAAPAAYALCRLLACVLASAVEPRERWHAPSATACILCSTRTGDDSGHGGWRQDSSPADPSSEVAMIIQFKCKTWHGLMLAL